MFSIASRRGQDSVGRFGYAGAILRVDLSRGDTTKLPTSDYADRFLGGRGLAARLYWDQAPPGVEPLSADNCVIFAVGPLAGFTRVAGSRWQVCGKAPATDPPMFSYANGGGSWGAWLRFAGFDAVAVVGRSDRPVFLHLHDGHVEIRDASGLWGCSTVETRRLLKNELGASTRVVSIGPAGENGVRFATLLADDDASASSGFGAVLGSKNLKAIAVSGNRKPEAADPGRLKALADRALELRQGTWGPYPARMAGELKRHACFGCVAGCARATYRATTGERGKFFCQAGIFYMDPVLRFYGAMDETAFHAGRLCNEYGLNTNVIEPMIAWLGRCHEAGVLSEDETGLPLSKIGSYDFIEALVRRISLREGFGDALALGTTAAARSVGRGSEALIGQLIGTKADEDRVYDPRLYNITALLYATEPRKPVRQLHEVSWPMVYWASWTKRREGNFISSEVLRHLAERFWGGAASADLSTYEGVALAAKTIQDRACAEDCLIVCDYTWPMTWVRHSEDHLGDTSLESQLVSAVTGEEIDEPGLNRIGERVFNLQRAILLRDGHEGRNGDVLLDFFHTAPLESEPHLNRSLLAPGKNGEVVCRKGSVLDRTDFERLKDQYYDLRGWDARTGVPTAHKLASLDLEDIRPDICDLPP